MCRRLLCSRALVEIVLASAIALPGGGAFAAGNREGLPPFSSVKKTVQKHLASRPDYRDGDIIARGDVEPLLKQLEAMGWKVADRRQIVEQVLDEGSFLVSSLRTTKGRIFMRKIASHPDAYDRLDRLARLPHGRQTVHDLIYKVGGAEMIEYMTAVPGGKNLGKQLSNAPKGRNFNKPTGQIYTAEALLARLKKSHEAAEKAAAAGK